MREIMGLIRDPSLSLGNSIPEKRSVCPKYGLGARGAASIVTEVRDCRHMVNRPAMIRCCRATRKQTV